jgi:hypothetical protein
MYEAPPVIRGPSSTTEKGGVEFASMTADSLTDHTPHRLWLAFFSEMYGTSKGRSTDETELLARCVLKALHSPKKLTRKPSSFGTRFHLLKLSIELLQEMDAEPSFVIAFNNERLRERIYVAALMWFSGSPGFYEASTSRQVAEKDFDLIIQFATRIKSDNRWWKTAELDDTSPSKLIKSETTKVLGSKSVDGRSKIPHKVSRQVLLEGGSRAGSKAGQYFSQMIVLTYIYFKIYVIIRREPYSQ